ncbi:MAG: peptidylprolyl isomerase [Burkholderiaceae bacterium]|nr:peptidylprolyl isomerase [Burkholderiaceae bacterium]
MNVKTSLLAAAIGQIVVGAWLGAHGAPALAQQKQVVGIDRVVAVVNNQVITASQLAKRVEMVTRQVGSAPVQLPPADVLEKQVLERLIIERVQEQKAAELGIRVDDGQLALAIAGVARENRLSPEGLRARIEAQGDKYDSFREQVRTEIVRVMLREREVDSKVQVSEADIDAYLAGHDATGVTPPEYLLAQILLRVSDKASRQEIDLQGQRAQELERQLQGGADFETLRMQYPDNSTGDMGWRRADELPEMFAVVVTPLKPGQYSPLLRSPAGFHILKLIDKRGGAAPASTPIMQTKVRHILIRPSATLSEAEVERRVADIKARLDTGKEDFAALARQYSADGSAAAGGDLGWIYPGDAVPEFERAMNALRPGQLSGPVITPFGIHLIQVLERRQDVASPERQRQAARQVLRARRIESATDAWLRELRDEAYVEYRLGSN